MYAGDIVKIDLYSRGCFHNDTFSIEIEKLPQTRFDSCAILRVKKNTGNPGYTTQMFLSIGSLTNLDGWIQYYRSETDGGCTTTDWLTLHWISGQDTTEVEKFRDTSCASSFSEGFSLWLAIGISEICCEKPKKKICKKYRVKCSKQTK